MAPSPAAFALIVGLGSTVASTSSAISGFGRGIVLQLFWLLLALFTHVDGNVDSGVVLVLLSSLALHPPLIWLSRKQVIFKLYLAMLLPG